MKTAAIPGPRCASVQGFSLHADVCVPARDRRRLERLSRYVGRPPVATERLSELPDGRILYRLRHRWRDLVVRDREGLSTSGRSPPSCPCQVDPSQEGASAKPMATGGSEAGLPVRGPGPPGSRKSAKQAVALREEKGRAPGPVPLRERRLSWSELLRRVFAIDAFRCDRCGGRMRTLAAIDQPEVIRTIVDCLGLNSRAPPLTPAPSPEQTDLELGFEEHWPID